MSSHRSRRPRVPNACPTRRTFVEGPAVGAAVAGLGLWGRRRGSAAGVRASNVVLSVASGPNLF
jgi:hypothetical protein